MPRATGDLGWQPPDLAGGTVLTEHYRRAHAEALAASTGCDT
jgi:hypothetical protein